MVKPTVPRREAAFREQLETQKRASVGQLLFKCARLLNEQALARVQEQTGQAVRASHTALFPHVDLDGTRLTELARRAGLSKQQTFQLVEELEAMGLLERVPDPEDGRARLVRFSRRGRRGLLAGLAVLRGLEAELGATIGEGRMADLHDTLVRLEAVLARR